MKLLSNNETHKASGGSLKDEPFFNTCTSAVINVLRYRNDMLEAFLAHDSQAQQQAAVQMRYFQTKVEGNCDFEYLRDTGAVNCDLFLF